MSCRLFVSFLCLLLVTQSSFAAQADVGLRIQVMQGDDARNVVEQIPAIPITVRVTDRNNRPIPGATVVFTSPETGASGDFANGLTTFSAVSDESGTAVAREYRPNDISGTYQIRVRAEYLGEVAATMVRQTNIVAKKSMGKLIAIMAVAGAAGVAGAALAARGGNNGSSPSSNPTGNPGSSSSTPTISFGGSTVGGPK
jgi:hypothetical protein